MLVNRVQLIATFNEDATVHQGNKQNYKAIKLYAIIAEPNGTLDIARKTHTEHVEDIAKRMYCSLPMYSTETKECLL